MGNDFVISVKSIQLVNRSSDEIQLVTSCKYKKEEDYTTIKYEEFDENTKVKTKSTITIDKLGLVTILREGASFSKLILEKEKHHICNYATEYGIIALGTFTKDIACDLNENGGTLKLYYSLDVSSNLLSENTVIINLKRS